MQAIILATSETSRLQPLTDSIPTAMLPVLNRPIMVGVIEQLAQQGLKNVLVSLYHLPGSVEAYFGSGQRWNISIEYILQREPWGTAGALKWAENSLTDTFLVLPADQIFELDFKALLTWHKAHKSQATIVIRSNGTGPGVALASNGRVTALCPADTTPSPLGFSTGIYLFESSVLQAIPFRTVWGITEQLLPHLIEKRGAVYGYPLSGFWKPIESFGDFQTAQWSYLTHLELGDRDGYRSPIRPEIPFRAHPVARGIWVGRNTLIDPSVSLSPPIFIGENCFIGPDVELGPEAMIGSNVLVDDGATIAHSTILDNTYVGRFVHVKKSIVSAGLLIDVETGDSTQVVDQFLLGEARSFGAESFFQRLPDVLLALMLLLGFSPFLLGVALAAWLASGNIVSRVEQVGTHTHHAFPAQGENPLRIFTLFRFSTRKSNGEITSLGKWLEKWELHRLLELWNIVIGDLRLIGVRSLSLNETSKMIERWQQKRNEYFPGFTGLWYLQTHSTSTLDEILIADAYYVATRTWRDDLRIFWLTLPAWWKRAKNPIH